MGNFCIVPTSAHTKLYDRISQSWKTQSQIEGLTIPKVVEWVGAYLNKNGINDPTAVPSANELVKFIDAQRRLEGKTAFSDLGQEVPVQIPYTLPGQGKHMYTVIGTRIYNEHGEERFKESDPAMKTHRNRIFANLAVRQGNAVIVEYRGSDYVVYKNNTIVSASGNTPGHVMNWAENDGNRKVILSRAREKFNAQSAVSTTATNQNTPPPSQTDSQLLNSITRQLVSKFVDSGIQVHSRKGIERYLQTHGNLNDVTQAIEAEKEMDEIKAKAIADGTFMKAPNGKDTNLTERQWLQVRTKNFINWFGDWINDPANASKIVDENGEPKVVYHGTLGEFTEFDFKRLGEATGRGSYKDHITGEDIPFDSSFAFFFTDNKIAARSYKNLAIWQQNSFRARVYRNLQAAFSGNKYIFKKLEGAKKQKQKEFIDNIVSPYMGFDVLREANNVMTGKSTLTEEQRKQYAEKFKQIADKINRIPDAASVSNTADYLEDKKGELQQLLENKDKFTSKKPVYFSKKVYLDITSGAGNTKKGEVSLSINQEDDGYYVFGLPNIEGTVPVTQDNFDLIVNEFRKGISQIEASLAKEEREGKYDSKGNILEVFLNIKNPLEHDYNRSAFTDDYLINAEEGEPGASYYFDGENWVPKKPLNIDGNPFPTGYIAARQVRKARKEGNDGVVYKNIRDPYKMTSYGIFDGNQVKSATANSGEFSLFDNDIQAFMENPVYDDFNPYHLKRRGAIVLSSKVSEKFSKYLEKSRGVYPKEFYDEVRDLLYVKSNNRKNSIKYDIVNARTGEVFVQGVPLYTREDYIKLKERADEINKEINPDWKPSDARSFAFRSFLSTPSKGLFKFAAKQYLREAAALDRGEKVNYTEIVDRFVDSFSDDFWKYVITSTLNLSKYGKEKHLEGLHGATAIGGRGSLEYYFIHPEGISKKALIYRLEQALGIKIRGKDNFGTVFSEDTPYNDLLREMRQWYNYRYNNTTEEESIALYAKDHGFTVEEVKGYLKKLTESGSMADSNTGSYIRSYSKYDSVLNTITKEYNEGYIKYLQEHLKDKVSEKDLRKIFIVFNRDTSSQFMLRLATVLHEPYHALNALQDTTDIRQNLHKFLQTQIGRDIFDDVKKELIDSGYSENNFEEEFLANLFSYYMTPEELRSGYLDSTSKTIKALAQGMEELESIPNFTKTVRVENVTEFKKQIEHYTEEEKVVLTFFQKIQNAISRFLQEIYSGFSNLVKEIPETRTVEKTREIKTPVTRQIEREILQENTDVTKAKDALDDIFSTMYAMMQAPVSPDTDSTADTEDVLNTEQRFQTPEGEVYGFVDKAGEMYLDETVVKPEHPIHEYTHLWDRAVASKNPKLWKRGISLMKQTSLWKTIEDDPNYGQKWKELKESDPVRYENRIASEVHARLVGKEGEKWLVEKANELGSDSLIAKLQQWLVDFWRELKATFGNWSDSDLATLTLADFNHMTVRDMISGVNPNTVKSVLTMQTSTSTAPSTPSPAREETLSRLRDYYRWQKGHIAHDKKHHKYYIDGKLAEFSVTEYSDKILGKKEFKEDYSHSQSMGNSVDALTRDFFIANSGYLMKKYPNLNDKRKAEVIANLKRFKEYLDGRFKNKDGKPEYTVITSEMYLAGRIKDGDSYKTIAGTPDMLVIDSEGKVHIFDMKVKRHSIEAYDDRKRYTFQLNAYRQLIEAAMPELKGKVEDLQLIWFDTSYPNQGTEARFVTDDDGNVAVTDLKVDNLPLAEYSKWETPHLRRDVNDSIKRLTNGDNVLPSVSPVDAKWREKLIAERNNVQQPADINKISDKTAAFGVVIDPGLKANYKEWQKNNPSGIVAFRVDFNNYSTPAEVKAGHIGNPFSEGSNRGAQTVQQFYDWIVTGNSYGNGKATEGYRKAIINKLLETPDNSPVLYYTELDRPSHATVIGYLINNKPLLEKAASPQQTATQQSVQQQVSLPGPDTKMEIWWGSGEKDPKRQNADLSNFAERPLNFGGIVAYSLPEGSKYGAFTSKYSIYDIGKVTYSTKNNPESDESFVFDGLSDLFRNTRFKTVEGAFQAAKLAFTHPKGNGAKANKYWELKTYKTSDNSVNGVFYSQGEIFVLSEEGKQLLKKLQEADGSQAKALGRQIVGLDRNSWDANSSKVMKALIGRSFEDNSTALQRLLDTGNATLTHDNASPKDKWRTEFPKLLMEVREELSNEHPEVSPTQQPSLINSVQQPATQQSSQSSTTDSSQASEKKNVQRPESPAFESALKKPDERLKNFYSTFTPQQIKDRGAMIADYFSKGIDKYIREQLSTLDSEIAVLDEIISSSDYAEADKEDARRERTDKARLRELLKDPIKGRQAAVQNMGLGNLITAIKKRIRSNIRGRNAARDKKWQDTLDYFTDLFNLQASMDIEENEGIRIIDLDEGKVDEATSAEQDAEDENDGNEDTGHDTSSGNDGWIFKIRYTDPFNSLSKRVKKIMYNIEMNETDDLGNVKKYSMPQIYVSLLSFLSKEMQTPDDFIRVDTSILEDRGRNLGTDFNGKQINSRNYPAGYPTFPVLESMRNKYPWVRQLINRLTQDYQSPEYNTELQYSPTMGAVCSQFYTNFRKAFIPYGKIQVGKDADGKEYTGVTPLNYDMEEQSQLDRLKANFNNGFTMTPLSIYNADMTINREHAKELVKLIDKADVNVANHSHTFMHLNDRDLPPADEDKGEMYKFIKNVQYILMSFGIGDRSNDDYIMALLGPADGAALVNILHDLREMADDIANLSDSKAAGYNYIVSNENSSGANRWDTFFHGRGFITDVSYVQSFYDSTLKKTKYSYSADNYLQKTFRELYDMDDNKRRAYMDEHYKKYEWFYDHEADKWRNKWLEILYEGSKGRYGHIFTSSLPYRNIDNITYYDKNTATTRSYVDWEHKDIWYVQDRNYGGDESDFGYYLAPIFADAPMSMTIRGPKMSREDVIKAFVSLVEQEMWRIKYVTTDRAQAIREGRINPIANFDLDEEGKGRGKEFCFIPELNRYRFPDDKTFLQKMAEMKKDKASKEAIEDVQIQVIEDIMAAKYEEYYNENKAYLPAETTMESMELEYLNMAYANVAIIQATTVDLAFYSSDVDFQKRFKEVYAGGIQLNTNSRYGKKTENVILVEDDVIVSPSYENIEKVINGSSTLSTDEKNRILKLFREVNVADAQAMRAMHSFRAVMDMMGNWDNRRQEALDRFENGKWTMEDFDIIYQTIKPFVYAVIDKNSGLVDADGKPIYIPVPVQHKNSEICMLMMYDLITRHSGFENSEVYKGVSEFMDEIKDADGRQLIDMIQYESAGKVGNQGVISISYSRKAMQNILKNGIKIGEKTYTYDSLNAEYQEEVKKRDQGLPNNASAVLKKTYKKVREDLEEAWIKDRAISQEEYRKIFNSLRPDKNEIKKILTDTALLRDGANYTVNPEYVQTVPFDCYYQSQPTPAHHIDADTSFGSQARNIIVADLPENLRIALEGLVKGKRKNHEMAGRDSIIDFFYELLDENLLDDFYGVEDKNGNKVKKGLVDIFKDKKSLKEAVEEVVRGNPKYGKDFADAFKIDSDGNYVLPPDSPNMFHLVQDIITSFFKNHITKQKINGAALIQAAGIGLDKDLRVLFDNDGKPKGAECYLPAYSRRFFEPFLKTDSEGNRYLDADSLKESGLAEAIGYRIPTENKSSMIPLIVKGFTPMQNGSCVVLPAEITTLAGSDFDVDKLYVILSAFTVQNYNYKKAWNDFKHDVVSLSEVEYAELRGDAFYNAMEDADPSGITDEFDEEFDKDYNSWCRKEFKKWFEENKEDYLLKTPVIKKVQYDFDKAPSQNSRRARNNMLLQIMYKILLSKEGSESLFNPQGFPDVERTAKMMKILTNGHLKAALYEKFGSDMDKMVDFLLHEPEKGLKKFLDEHYIPESPIYPQTFAHSHARNMAGTKQIGIYALQASMSAKFQRANITIKEHKRVKIDGTTYGNVDKSEGGRRLKNNGQMVGASADNGKKPNLTDMGSTNDTAPLIGYLLRMGLSHTQAALLIAQPEMVVSTYSTKGFLKWVDDSPNDLPQADVTSDTLVRELLEPGSSGSKSDGIARAIWEILCQYEGIEYINKVSRADSPNGAMDNSFAGARLQQYKVDLMQGKLDERDFPFTLNGALSNTAVDVSQGKDAVREALKKQPMAFLHGMYALGINSLNELASPFFYMLSKRFDDEIVKPILYNMPERMADEKKKRLIDRIYTDYITFVLSDSRLFGNEEEASAMSKRDYYLLKFPDDFRKILQDNPDIRDLIGPILMTDNGRVVLKNVGSLMKGQKEDVSRRLTSLIYGIDPNNPNPEAQKLAKDLLMFSYYDSGINFRHDSYSSVLSTQFLVMIEAYTDALRQAGKSLGEDLNNRFINQYMLTHTDAAPDTKSIRDKDWFSDDGDTLIMQMDLKGLPNRWIINPSTTINRRFQGVKPYTYLKHFSDIYKLDEEKFKANGSQAEYVKVTGYWTTDARPIYSAQNTLEELAKLYPAYEDTYEIEKKKKKDKKKDTSMYDSITQTAPPPVTRKEAQSNPAVQATNNSSSPIEYNPKSSAEEYDVLNNGGMELNSLPPEFNSGSFYDGMNDFSSMSYEDLQGGPSASDLAGLFGQEGEQTLDNPQCKVVPKAK